jgi:HAD superfamily hydrolase (TIGR01549 family)
LNQRAKKHDIDSIIEKKWSLMKKSAGISIDEIPGSINLIKRLYKDNYRLAVASASDLEYVKIVLDTLKITPYFKAIIGGDMVSKGKPDPEIFLLAASKIGILPKNCIVIEDGRSGMEGAKNAKMKCIGLVANKQSSYPTLNLVSSLVEITSDYLEQLK